MKIIRGAALDYLPASHEDPKNPGALKKVLVKRGEINDGHLQMINWAMLPKGSSFRNHYHEDMDEVFVIMKGNVEIRIEDENDTLGPGDAVIVPLGKKHQMQNIGVGPAEYLVIGISLDKGGKTVTILD